MEIWAVIELQAAGNQHDDRTPPHREDMGLLIEDGVIAGRFMRSHRDRTVHYSNSTSLTEMAWRTDVYVVRNPLIVIYPRSIRSQKSKLKYTPYKLSLRNAHKLSYRFHELIQCIPQKKLGGRVFHCQ